jgi:dTDP-glucose 4,6-dehydratase
MKSKSVLITGAGGFIGSHLTERLVDLGAKVRALIHYNASNHWGWLETLPKETLEAIEVVPGDVRDHDSVMSALKGVDVVFHLAALISIPYSYRSPVAFVKTNIQGTLNILEGAKQLETEKVLVTSTSEVYGTAQYTPIDEVHPLQAQSPYSATKISADKLAESFYRSFELPVTIVRPFNTFGPRQSARAIIPTIITQLMAGRQEIVLGALTPVRDFVYVKDTVEGFIEIANADETVGEEINICSQAEISVGQVAKVIIARISPETTICSNEERMRPEASEVHRLLGSNDKIRRLTRWKPHYSFEEGISETIDWFLDSGNMKGYKPHLYNI